MTLYAVVVERMQSVTIYTHADEARDACADAKELAEGVDEWDDVRVVDTYANEIENVPTGHSVWSGGEDGRWIEP